MADFTFRDIAKMFDHSLLQPNLTDAEMEAGLQVARAYDVASVCVKPYYVRRAADVLTGSGVKVCTVIGFPHGSHRTDVKAFESERAMDDGATELDMVCNVGKVLSGDWVYVAEDIRAVVKVAHQGGAIVKVIFENCYLKDEHKIRLCRISGELGADWVKTSTGYGTGGATMEDLTLMRRHAAPGVQVKAAGGVRDLDTLLRVRALGVTRVGASRTREILDDCRRRLGLGPVVPGGRSGGRV